MPAPDLQHQRLRHLFASAILDLWKKETGSVTSVLIEGTVCVTVHGGRTTVVQLCDRFAGLVNGDCDSLPDVGGGRLRHCDGHLYVAPATLRTPATAVAKPRGWPAAAAATTVTQSKDSNNNVRAAAPRDRTDLDDTRPGVRGGVETDDDDCSFVGDDDVDDGQSSMIMDDDEAAGTQIEAAGHPSSGSGSFSPETGSGRTKLDVDDVCADDSAIHDMSMNGTANSPPDDSPSVQSPPRGRSKTPASNSGGNDLLLSSPHDYTAQVRNVIRQRLLNATGKQPTASSFRGQSSIATTSGSVNAPADNALGNIRPPSSTYQYYRAAADSTPPPSMWIKREMPPSAAASEAMATAARRLASQYAAAAATGHIPMPLMSPLPPLGMSVGLPMPGVPLNASLHNLLGVKSTMAAVAPVLMPGSVSSHVPPSAAADSKLGISRPLGSIGVDAPLAGTSGDAGQAPSEQKIYRCDYCHKTFLFKSKYHEHLPVHTSARPFQCHLCTRTYKYKYDLRVHLRTHLGIPTKSTVCPFCAARFATNKFLRQHMREAHSDQNVVTSVVPPAGDGQVTLASAGPEVLPTAAADNVDGEAERDGATRTDSAVDYSTDDVDTSTTVAATASPLPAAETVNAESQNDDASEM